MVALAEGCDTCRTVAEEPSPTPEVQFLIEVPTEIETGQYSNFLSVWSGPHDFTLDFGVLGQSKPSDEPGSVVVPVRVVSRVKVPLTMAQDVLRALAENVSRFEEKAGRIWKPGDDRPMYPPEEAR